ncbi:hypothetical protein FGW37_05510 [Streptomyces rectiverticillatus]|uniref:hypothetical protein n=1 Tax=Streptomyces rectiverticillatus TaxID=173860 RepID=UPI0015C3E65D|nr:hypothetical protein [Streptomyces rectiverticillatus]QLE71133.1 hypothetical protein FGW37_05510 [Streptomyces rectiverticillatus]
MSRRKRIARIAAAIPFVEELAEYTKECHKGASMHIDREAFEGLWYALPISRTRDAKALEESNYAVIERDLTERFPETVEAHSFGHWGYGWYERLYVRRDDAAALLAAQQWVDALASYGIADEEHYSETEYEHNHPSERECYSNDPDCGCEVKSHECSEMLSAAVESGEVASADEAWWCDFCNEWRDLDDSERARLVAWEYRKNCRAMEGAGQLALEVA